MELCLGTCQFGMDYGIAGQKKPALEDAVSWIDFATQNGIRAIDTAEQYGNAHEVVGAFLKKHTLPREKLFISTKVMPNILDDVKEDSYVSVIKAQIEKTLMDLNTDYVDAYIFHSARYVFNDSMIEALYEIKKQGYARKIGVSVYEPNEAMRCIDNSSIEFMQLPYSIFDHRMKEAGVFDRGEESTTEIHSRSAFIQGLILMDESRVPAFLSDAKPIVKMIDNYCEKYKLSRVNLAMSYVEREKAISHLVFGVDNLEQLKENIANFEKPVPEEILAEMQESFKGIRADIVMPSLWKK